MAEAAFDMMAEVQRLRDAGFEQAQAEAVTRAIHTGVTGGVATKADLALVRKDLDLVLKELDVVRIELEGKIEAQGASLEGKIEAQGASLEAKIERAKFDLTWRLLGGIAILNGLMIAVLRLLPPPG